MLKLCQFIHARAVLRFIFSALVGLNFGSLTFGAELVWEQGAGFRSAALPVAKPGKAGFTRLPSQLTSVTFSNRLSDDAAEINRILENGSGVALGDVDGDGWCDLYFCRLEGPNVLYRNRGGWKFEDITTSAGVACPNQFSTGAAFTDVDGDGDADLLVNSIGGGTRLFLNNGRGQFAESQNSGLLRKLGATSLALADVDADGDLDLYVTNYRTTNYKDAPPDVKIEIQSVDGRIVVAPEERFLTLVTKRPGSGKFVERGEPDQLYLNDGKGRFTPVSWTGGAFLDEAGRPLAGPPLDWGLAAMFRDINGDGAPDLYVCNDFLFSRDRVWLNDGRGKFRAQPALALRHISSSSMSVDFADINRDGFDDFFVADMLSQSHELRQRQRPNLLKDDVEFPLHDLNYTPEVPRNTLFLNRGDGTFAEIAPLAGVAATEWTWSAVFLDVDLDGFEDLLVTNGNNHDVLDADAQQHPPPPEPGKPATTLRHCPRLFTGNLAFRNRGDLTFADASADWKFNAAGVSHGMALADLDLDGDLDVVMNNLNEEAGLYRNEISAARVAVRLKGRAPNGQGIGAKIKVGGGPVPPQSQEVICGGRYVSSDEPLRVFAAGEAGTLVIEVTWPDGTLSLITNAQPNRIYEVDQNGTINPAPGREIPKRRTPFFEDVSHLISHAHEDELFDDFARQPQLWHKLSQLGPGVTWFDFDGDGWEDLIMGGGRGGRMGVFRNDGKGGFNRTTNDMFNAALGRDQTAILGWHNPAGEAVLLAGSSNYEDGLTNGAALKIFDFARNAAMDGWRGQFASMGPLAMADVDGDGDLDLFAGGRVLPGRFPEDASSRLYRIENGRFRLDVENTRRLAKIGMISGAVFSDFDGDGDADLILACDWGPVRVLRNEGGQFTDATEALGLSALTGRWNGVATGDFDGDGRLDIAASNWGRNTHFQARLEQPLRIVHGDFNGDGSVEFFENYFDPALRKVTPWATRDAATAVLPELQERFPNYRSYSTAGVEEIMGSQFKSARTHSVTTLDSMIFLNRGQRFEARPMPVEAQFAPAFGLAVGDLDGDGSEDLFLAQNFFDVDPEIARLDAGLGLWLRGDGQGGFKALSAQESGVRVFGQQRGCAVADFDGDGRLDLAVAQNRAGTKIYRNASARPGLRVRLAGPAGNPSGAGAQLRLKSGGRWGPRREVHCGSGYWSQNGAVQILCAREAVDSIEVRWPGGAAIVAAVPSGAREIKVSSSGEIVRVR